MALIVQDLCVAREGKFIIHSLSLNLLQGQHLAILGTSGSGKTTLALALCGRIHFSGNIVFAKGIPQQQVAFVGQMHQYKNKSNTNDFYYQQRYNSFDADDAMTAAEWIGLNSAGDTSYIPIMGIEHLLHESLVQLSNGEHKKVQIARALLHTPSILILDQPFAGLDATSRQQLHEILNSLAAQGLTVILISTPHEMPACITHVLELKQNTRHAWWLKNEFISAQKNNSKTHLLDDENHRLLLHQLCGNAASPAFEYAIRMKDVHVSYGGKFILQHINWEVRKGERWLLHGPNGAGKSTLLSLVTADNPQAYANEVYLFDKRRGSGESIWDIKKHTGFVSPELHACFNQSASCFETIASGLFDTIGLFRKLNVTDETLCLQWLQLFGLEKKKDHLLRSLPMAEQRLLLLARALIKNPPLLILDEPCQGLDDDQQQTILRWIDEICLAGNKTMVFITHYQNEKPSCIDKMLELRNGEIATSH